MADSLSVKQPFFCSMIAPCGALFHFQMIRKIYPFSVYVCIYLCFYGRGIPEVDQKGKREDFHRHCEGHRLNTVFSSGQLNSLLTFDFYYFSSVFFFFSRFLLLLILAVLLKLIAGLPHSFLVLFVILSSRLSSSATKQPYLHRFSVL